MRNSKHLLVQLSVLAACAAVSAIASAEQPSANVQSPQPAPPAPPTAAVPPPPPSTGPDIMEAPPSVTTTTAASFGLNEPTIDTTTEKKTFLNRPLFFTGLTLFGGAYAASTIVAATNDRPSDDKLYYPVVGPWMDLADRGCSTRGCASGEGINTALLVTSGVAQGIGALGIVTSLIVPEKTTKNWWLLGNVGPVKLSPGRVGHTGTGLTAGGTF
jgi:hypothetical protein